MGKNGEPLTDVGDWDTDPSQVELDPKDEFRFNVGNTTDSGFSTVRQSSRSYKCPRCDGEFNSWWEEGGIRSSKHCPFCDLQRGHYYPDE